MPTLIVENSYGMAHETPPEHPERVARLTAVNAALSTPRFAQLHRCLAPIAEEAVLRLAHPQNYIDNIRDAIPNRGITPIDADTYASAGSWNAALAGVGGCITAVDTVLNGTAQNAFVATRPPGHHAERNRAMGFCLFSNIAIAARHALENRGLERVAIIDFDVHHGNGTQDVMWDESRALFISSHQMPLYPGTGAASEQGASRNVLNVPLPPGSDGATMRRIYEDTIFPRLRVWNPDLILVSAGFDAHANDPLANLMWQADDFAWITKGLCNVAADICQGRVVACLEGGYDTQALAESVTAHVAELMEHTT